MNQYYEVTSNREAGEGRYDIQLKPRTSKLPGFLIEIKTVLMKQMGHADIEKKLEELAQKGLQQIEQKQYISELKAAGCSKIIQLGVAFYKKKCRVVCDFKIL